MLEYLTCGGSHSPENLGILSGFPAGVKVGKKYIELQLKRRSEAPLRGPRQKKENDNFRIVSGIDEKEITDGSPIGIILSNNSMNFNKSSIVRPGHADFAGALKYGVKPWQIRERASARETAARTALFCFTMRLIEELDIKISSKVISINGEKAGRKIISKYEKSARSVGGIFEIRASNLPIGLGSHIKAESRLSAHIFSAFGSLNAVKGVEIGDGFSLSSTGKEDCFKKQNGLWKYSSNFFGGINGGMTNGEDLIVRCAARALSGSRKKIPSFDFETGEKACSCCETSDISCVYAAAVIGEFLLSFVLAKAVLEKFGSDSLEEISGRVKLWRKNCRKKLRK